MNEIKRNKKDVVTIMNDVKYDVRDGELMDDWFHSICTRFLFLYRHHHQYYRHVIAKTRHNSNQFKVFSLYKYLNFGKTEKSKSISKTVFLEFQWSFTFFSFVSIWSQSVSDIFIRSRSIIIRTHTCQIW